MKVEFVRSAYETGGAKVYNILVEEIHIGYLQREYFPAAQRSFWVFEGIIELDNVTHGTNDCRFFVRSNGWEKLAEAKGFIEARWAEPFTVDRFSVHGLVRVLDWVEARIRERDAQEWEEESA